MSAEKNTKMPEGYDMSFAENLGKESKKTKKTETPDLQFNVQQTTGSIPTNIYEDLTHDHPTDANTVNTNITDAITQPNTEVLSDAPDLAMASLYQTTGSSIGLHDSVTPADAATAYNIYEDLTHDHHTFEKTAETNFAPTVNKPSDDNSLENIMWESEAQMDAYFDGHVTIHESENLNT